MILITEKRLIMPYIKSRRKCDMLMKAAEKMKRPNLLPKLVFVLVVVVLFWGASVVQTSGGLKDTVTIASVAIAELAAMLLGAIVLVDARSTRPA